MFRTIRQAAVQWQSDRASFLGAAVAYYTLFSIAPLLIIAIAVVGLVYGEDAVEGRLVNDLSDYVGDDSASTIQTIIQQTRHPRSNWWAFAVGASLLIVMALGLFQQIRTALHQIWKLPPPPSESLIHSTIKDYVLAFAMICVSVLFVLLVLLSTTVTTIIIEVWGHFLPGELADWRLANIGVTFVLITLLLVMTYRILSDRRLPYGCLWGGAALAAILFISGKWLFGVYLAHASLATTYGAASSVVVFLVWVYYTAQVFFFGAEVVQVKAQKLQSRKEKI
jgi:membrane protein